MKFKCKKCGFEDTVDWKIDGWGLLDHTMIVQFPENDGKEVKTKL